MSSPCWQFIHPGKPRTVDEVMEILLRNRNIDAAFLDGTLKDLEPHLAMQGLAEGAALMAGHLEAGNKMVLVGDYDCDGVTSLAQMVHFLRDIGFEKWDVVVPLRSEGYGVPLWLAERHPDARLVVAMDCGTLDVAAVEALRARRVDVIVIDHHEVPDSGLAPASVLINPKRASCPSTFKEFCSAGLTLLFLVQLRRTLNGRFGKPSLGGKYLVLSAIGTVADMAPLVSGNRILVRSGLQCLNTESYLPARELASVAGLSGRCLTAGHIGYYLGPRLNAAGRMDDARVALDLLVGEDPLLVRSLAQELNRLNGRRQAQEDLILREIRRVLNEGKDAFAERRTLVLGHADWPPGIVGIAASRVQQELHYGPVIILSVDEARGTARGSGRSVPGFDLHGALARCDDLLLRWGGHKMAAGLTLAIDRMEAFAERFETVAREAPETMFVPSGKVDAELDLKLISPKLVQTLGRLEPHGLGNPAPTFAVRKTRVGIRKAFGKEGNHLRLVLGKDTNGIYWRGAERFRTAGFEAETLLDVVFQVEWDDFRSEPVATVKDVGRLF